ncbi:MAG TPA: hypothetical protein VI953_04345 [Candidatus Paceibacterota bacterium]
MATINFLIPDVLNKQISKTIRKRGFASKAEFFRMAAFNYINAKEDVTVEERLAALTQAIKEEVSRKYKGRRLPSAREQLANL